MVDDDGGIRVKREGNKTQRKSFSRCFSVLFRGKDGVERLMNEN